MNDQNALALRTENVQQKGKAMCGRYNIMDSPVIRDLLDILGIQAAPEPRRNIAPGSFGQIVIERQGERVLQDALWSLLVEPKPNGAGYRPNPKFSTFNARSTRLSQSPLWKKRYPSQRCIVPASAFHEWAQGQPYNIYPQGSAVAMPGLWERWQFGSETVYSFATITLPPHPRFSHIHPRSIPLMLEAKDFDLWLDPDFHDVDAFADLMRTHIHAPLVCQPIRDPKTLEPVGEAEIIPPDR